MIKRLLIFSMLFVLIGCSQAITQKELISKEVPISSASKDVQEFIQNVRKENGYYLYLDGKATYYLFLNGSITGVEETVTHFSDLHLDAKQDVLTLSFQESQVKEESVPEPKSAILYKIQTDRTYDTLFLQVNGEEAAFDTIGGK